MDNQMHKNIALFARFPYRGKCKTRLAPRLGELGAASFARAALTDILHLLATTTSSCRRTLFYTPATAEADILALLEHESLLSSWHVQAQAATPDLGSRLSAGLEHFQRRGNLRAADIIDTTTTTPVVTFIGMDCFDLTGSLIQESMALESSSSTLETAHIIPAYDGGYVMLTIPLACSGKNIFHEIPWSCSRTGSVQIQRLEEAGLACVVGKTLPDVDEPDDLDRLWMNRERKRDEYPRVFAYLQTVMEMDQK